MRKQAAINDLSQPRLQAAPNWQAQPFAFASGNSPWQSRLSHRSMAALVLISLLVPLAASAQAPQQPAQTQSPWTKVGETGGTVLYVDMQSLRRDGNIRRVVELQDLKASDPDGVLSRRYINEYDCSIRMHRIGQVSSFTQNMLGGTRRFLVEEWGYWRTVQPNTLFSVVLSSVCGDILRN
jgi:hypothetical protein